ncbi:MAG: hypothetical protein IT427_08170 [Pirellulales bacterium]|nr:hypothetical protein [Pirellulales bacterium]
MSDSPSQSAAAAAPPPKMPGEVVRGLVSLWIIIHFLGIFLAIVTLNELAQSSNPSGGVLAESQLLNRLKQVPPIGQYINALWLDVPYNYILANGSPLDGDFSLRLELTFDNGKTEELTWPANNDWFGEHRARLARLALSTARAAEINNSRVAALIGKSILTQTGAKELVLSVYRHQPLSLEDARSSDPTQRDPHHRRTFVRVYTATVRVNSAGDVQVSVKQEALDVAAPNRSSSDSTTSPPDERSGSSESNAPSSTPRQKPNRQRADPLPLPERPKDSSSFPDRLLNPTDPPADRGTPQK